MGTHKSISVTDFINTGYRDFWCYNNKGKNSIEPREGMPEVVRRVVYAAYCLNIKEHDEHKTIEVKGELSKIHPHSDSSLEDSIKGVATAYKSQPATRILQGVGNFGSAPGDEGAAARYTSVSGTPLLTAMYRDIPFVPMSVEETGVEQPEYVSCPLPLALINGQSAIGTGKSCYVAERDAREVIHWLDALRKANWDQDQCEVEEPDPMSVTGCETWYNPGNGYIYYKAVVHYGVDANNLDKRGPWDVITALPPKSTPAAVIAKLQDKLPTRVAKRVTDGSGKGRPLFVMVPKGYLEESDFAKYGLQNARKEFVLLWDDELNTMRVGGVLDLAKGWFDDRCHVVTRRLQYELAQSQAVVHRVNLIKEFAKNRMQDWKSDDVVAYFVQMFPETGEQDANIVMGLPVRNFLPENVGKNEVLREKELQKQQGIQERIDNIGDTVIQEAYDIIERQERFFGA